MTLQQARQLLPAEYRNMSDSELSALLSQLYGFADLVIDIFLERRKAGGANG